MGYIDLMKAIKEAKKYRKEKTPPTERLVKKVWKDIMEGKS